MRLEPANVQVLEWLFPERKRLAEPGAGPADERYLNTSKNFGAPRFRALYRQWLEDPTNTLWMAGSTTLADALERDHGRVECVELSRQVPFISLPWLTSPDNLQMRTTSGPTSGNEVVPRVIEAGVSLSASERRSARSLRRPVSRSCSETSSCGARNVPDTGGALCRPLPASVSQWGQETMA